MSEKKMIKSLNSVEGYLILSFIILVSSLLILIGVKFSENSTITNVLMLSLIVLITVVAGVGMFHFVKYKYVQTVKDEILEDLDKYMSKSDTKVNETNSRIYAFETNYSKKLKKISKDYALKAKEISDVKKELEVKLQEVARQSAYFEIEVCNMKLETIEGNTVTEASKKAMGELINRIIEINNNFPGISKEETLEALKLRLLS